MSEIRRSFLAVKQRLLVVFAIAFSVTTSSTAHHEAIFGPQSATLISHRRFASAQYYLAKEGRQPQAQHSHIGVFTVGIPIGDRFGVSATLPFESERERDGNKSGVQDVVIGLRYFPDLGHDRWIIGAFTFEPPTGNLEHKSLGFGGGVIYGMEGGHWSGIVYGLGRTEAALTENEKLGDRVFVGGGLAYEHAALPFSPQLGMSWEHTGRSREQGVLLDESRNSVLMVHPTFSKTFRNEILQTFLVFSIPVVQSGGSQGWQRSRLAAGFMWSF